MLARDGRGGGGVPFIRPLSLLLPLLLEVSRLAAAKGSRSTGLGAVGVVRLCFRGGAFCSELRIRELCFAVEDGGGPGACLDGRNGSWKGAVLE